MKKPKSKLKSAVETNRYRGLAPIPTDIEDNVEYAQKRLEKQIPQAALELEWQLKFGDDKTRKEVALDILSFKGITKKSDGANQVVPAIQLIMNGQAPWTQVTIDSKPKNELVEGELVKEQDGHPKKIPS